MEPKEQTASSIQVLPGRLLPLGATVTDGGTNFSIFSRHGTRVWLMLFDEPAAGTPSAEFELDPAKHRTGDIWHIHLAGIGHGQLYLYRIDGPYEPEQGHRFNPHKPLLDPYARAITGNIEWNFGHALGYDPLSEEGDISFSTFTDLAGMPKSIVYGDDGFDWQGDQPLQRPLNETIIYETHVCSLTCHSSAGVNSSGTYKGVTEKIPYFKDLGVTAIELLPVHQFNELELDRKNPQTGARLTNYWGYNTISFFCPHSAYSHLGSDRGQQVVAFKEMVRALHQAGLEVILDVVFNHTAEGNEFGPTLSFRGIDNSIYYLLTENPRYYQNFTGVGNTFNSNHPIGQDLIIDCLRYWVQEMHVDGFRFDLATSLSRDRWGNVSGDPALTARIAEDPVLRTAKIIAEPWDIGGYQVGHFPGGRWAEWNDRYRDQVRQYWRGDLGATGDLATRLAGSADLYHASGRRPNHSINMVAAHDGFTLNDLVSYNWKHNEANGENNHDGHDHNISYNYGYEGPSKDRKLEQLRSQQVKNFLATLLLSQGTPMINGGDEFRRTQHGNNNAYCQNNDISWYNWRFIEKYADVYRFTRAVIALRQAHPVFRRTEFFTGHDVDGDQFPDIHWYNADGNYATWDPADKALMCLLDGSKVEIKAEGDDVDVVIMFNAEASPRTFYLPPAPGGGAWRVAVDTGQESPNDAHFPGEEVELEPTPVYRVKAHSMVMLVAPI